MIARSLKHAVVVSALLLTTAAHAEGEGEGECAPPPEFDAFCGTGARTGALVEVIVGDDGPEIMVGFVYGEAIVATGDVLQLDCATPQLPTCGLPTQAAVLLTSPTTLVHSEPLIEGFQLQFAYATNRVTAQDALTAAVNAATGPAADPGLCIESLYVLSDTDRGQGQDPERCGDDGIFCGAGNSAGPSALGLLLLLRRRRPR